MKLIIFTFILLLLFPDNSHALNIQCSVDGYDDYSVEISLLNNKSAFFSGDQWTILNEVPSRNHYDSLITFNGMDEGDQLVSVKYNTAEFRTNFFISFFEDNQLVERKLTACSSTAKLHSGIDLKTTDSFSSNYELNQKATNKGSCISSFSLAYDSNESILKFGKLLSDNSFIIYSDYYFTNVNEPEFPSQYYGATGFYKDVLEQNKIVEKSKETQFLSKMTNLSKNKKTLKDFYLQINDQNMFFTEKILLTKPITNNECHYLEVK